MTRKYILLSGLALMIASTASCAARTAGTDPHEDYDSLEGYNRTMFKFNYKFDKYILRPLATGYRNITNQYTRDRVNNVIANLQEPLFVGNHLLQGEAEQSGLGVARFAINTTLGLLGMYDVAQGWGIKDKQTSFDATLAKWCVPDGPYIVLPLWGPSTPRATTGLMVDALFDPVYWATYHDANIRDKVMYSYPAIKAITYREANLEFLDELERDSVDFYATTRSAYMQNRSPMGCNASKKDPASSYDFDFGIDDEEQAFDAMENNK